MVFFKQLCIVVLSLFSFGAAMIFAQTPVGFTGSGSTAATPVFERWAAEYAKARGATLTYDAIGSSAGLRKLQQSGHSAFAASDVPLNQADLDHNKLVMAPMFLTAVVPIVNVPRVASGQLHLSGQVLAAIFSGQVTKWNAAAIRELNPGLNLPDLAIHPIVRAEGSGTSHYFTAFLSSVSPEWKATIGTSTSPKFPATFATAKSARLLAGAVKDTVGSIGYVDLTTAHQANVPFASLRNASGDIVQANQASIRVATTASDWLSSGNFQAPIVNMPGKGSWPIPMGVFVFLPRVADQSSAATHAMNFFVWALLHGDHALDGTDYLRLPDSMQSAVFRALTQVTDKSGRRIGFDALANDSKLQ